MQKSFYIYTFGCRVNQAESESLARKLSEKGLSIEESKPDLFIINSCAVTERAVAEARKLINRVKREKKDAKIVLTGCAANYWLKTQNTAVLEKLDLVVPNAQKDYLAEIILKRLFDEDSDSAEEKNFSGRSQLVVDKYNTSARILIKIQDGCHRFCSFCIVPYLRGLPKSYKISEIVQVINENSWAKEAILTAINTEAYGKDTGESFVDLIERVLGETSIERLSFGSIHPWSLDSEFISSYKRITSEDNFSNRFVHYFHIPLQSGSDKILNLMKREYKAEEVLEKVLAIAKLNPLAYFGTDVIVGFLEEDEEDFQQTYEFLEKSPFVKFHVFRFSVRKHTAAYYMTQRLSTVPDSEKKRRAKVLIDLGEKKQVEFREKLLKQRYFSALVLNKQEAGLYSAVLSNQYPVLIKAEEGKVKPGEIVGVSILEERKGSLIAKLEG